MSVNSNYYSILSAIQTQIINLGLEDWNSHTVPCVIRKVPKAQETLDALPMILVCPSDRPEEVKQFSFENLVAVKYRIEIVMVAAGEGDMSSHLDFYLSWREQLRQLFQSPLLPGVSTVFDTDVVPDVVIDREQVNNDYDYSGLTVTFSNKEIRV